MTAAHRLAKALMKTMPAFPPSPEGSAGELQEVFRHESFLQAEPSRRLAIMLDSSRSKYQSEIDYPWDHYFGIDLHPLLAGKEALDLGCFTGGRGIAWCERYGLARLTGVDVDEIFIEAANRFAEASGVPARFQVAYGERLPFEDRSFDAVLSYDVFEHARNVTETLNECHRVLKPKGRCFLVFRSYFQPVEHHLSLVTRVPGIQCLFSGRTLVQAYSEILAERGREAQWYQRKLPALEAWERSNTLNGITLRKFRKILTGTDWRVVLHSHRPIGSMGRRFANSKAARLLSSAFTRLTYVPGLQEVLLHRITYILEKPGA